MLETPKVGTGGKAAVIDTAWGLYREEDGSGATLEVTGRDIEPRKLALEFDGRSRGWGRREEGWLEVRTVVEIEVYELLLQMGEADAGTLARELGKHRTSVLRTLRRLRALGVVDGRTLPTHNLGGRKMLFRITEERAGRLTLAAP
jgi:hypothetical protein